MNEEELIGKLQMVYVGDKNALNELIGYYDGLKDVIEILQQENARLKDKIEKTIEFLEPFVEWNLCTLKGTMLKKPLEILKGDKEN